jgi:hypothetical protein
VPAVVIVPRIAGKRIFEAAARRPAGHGTRCGGWELNVREDEILVDARFSIGDAAGRVDQETVKCQSQSASPLYPTVAGGGGVCVVGFFNDQRPGLTTAETVA